MITLTKKYRLVYDINTKELAQNPYQEYSLNSDTITNSGGYYECDNIEEVNDKIDELGLIYIEHEPEVIEPDLTQFEPESELNDEIIDVDYEDI